ncbi:hypothetical protein DIPPA_05051 [Diplonema papillatum]|nr:hypothetical protein DIPPA_05051 [Diplonema papillatum]
MSWVPRRVLAGKPEYVAGKMNLLAQLSAWSAYVPTTFVPRILSSFHKRSFTKLWYHRTMLVQKGPSRERLEILVAGEKLFEGRRRPTPAADSQKFPEVLTTTGVFSPRSEMVIVSPLRRGVLDRGTIVAEWANRYPGSVSFLYVADDLQSWVTTKRVDEPGIYFCNTFDARPLYELIACQNTVVPFVFIVDAESRIRWRSCYLPTDSEIKFLAHPWKL